MTVMDNFPGWLSWMTLMDDWTLLFISYFYILMTDWRTDRLTLVLVKSLSRLKSREYNEFGTKGGGYLTRITIWKYSIIVKKLLGGGVERLTFPFFFHFIMIAFNKIYCLLPLPFSHKECQLNQFSFKCFPNIRFKSFEMIAFGTYCKIWFNCI